MKLKPKETKPRGLDVSRYLASSEIIFECLSTYTEHGLQNREGIRGISKFPACRKILYATCWVVLIEYYYYYYYLAAIPRLVILWSVQFIVFIFLSPKNPPKSHSSEWVEC